MKQFNIFLMVAVLSFIGFISCGGGSNPAATTPDDVVPANGDPCPNPEAHALYNLYKGIAATYEVTSDTDLKNRLTFFDNFKDVIGSNTPATISNLINNSSALSTFYSTWNSVVGSSTPADIQNKMSFYNTWNSIVNGYTTLQIQQALLGPAKLSGKKLFMSNILHNITTWNKFDNIYYGFTTKNAADIQVSIVNRSSYAVVENVVTKRIDGFSISIVDVPAGNYIVVVKGNYTTDNSYQETETCAFPFSR